MTDVSTSAERQKLTLSNGETISARLVVLANGLSVGLRHNLGIERQILSVSHSISIGFDMVPVGRPAFEFSRLTYFSESDIEARRLCDAFPCRKPDAGQPFRLPRGRRPLAARDARTGRSRPLNAALPRLRRITREYGVAGDVKIKPPISMSQPAIANPASFWSATPLRPPARLPAPAPTRCSPT